MSSTILRFLFACTSRQASRWKPGIRTDAPAIPARYTRTDTPYSLAGIALAEVGILIIDDDIVSQRALKNVLDSEGWRVRIVPLASAAMLELASGQWSLVIVNIAMTDVRGPLFNILKDLAQGDADALEGAEIDAARPKRIRVLFLVPLLAARDAQPILEKEGLPYLLKPYHLHDFLEKVGELLVEAGAIADPIRSMGDFSVATGSAAACVPPNAAAAAPCSPPATITRCPKKSCWNGNAPKKKTARSAKKNSKTANICSFRDLYPKSTQASVRLRIVAAESGPSPLRNPARNHLMPVLTVKARARSVTRANHRRRTPCIPATNSSGFPVW